jgi:hypothetical protein
MPATTTRSTSSANGRTSSKAATKARGAKVPALAAGATAAGLAGGLALGSRIGSKRRGMAALLSPRRKVLGVPIGRKNNLAKTAQALGQVARGLSQASNQASATTDEMRQIREQLDKANRRSPLEVLLDGLTHRRGAHKRES